MSGGKGHILMNAILVFLFLIGGTIGCLPATPISGAAPAITRGPITPITQPNRLPPPSTIVAVTPITAKATATASPLPNPSPVYWPFSPQSGPVPNPRIPNYGVIEEGIICRSAQPTEEQYRELVGMGFKSVINFRQEQPFEEKYIRGLGFQYYLFLDIPDENQPTDQQAHDFLQFVTNKQHWPIIMHCKVGVGRTGTMAALIRYAVDAWPLDQAIAEAIDYRGGNPLVQPQVTWLRQWAMTHPPGDHRPPDAATATPAAR
jgi:protein-tyrosine phosphatase